MENLDAFWCSKTFGHHKASRRWTWQSPNGQHHNQIDYIIVRKRFRSGENIARTLSFPGADIESNHDLLMLTFHLRLKRFSKPKHKRLKFDLENLKYPNMLETFQAMIGEKFVPLTIMNDEYTDLDSAIATFNIAVIETANEILGKHRQKKNPWVTTEFLICSTEEENWERNELNLKDMRNTEKWTTTSRGACKRQKKTG